MSIKKVSEAGKVWGMPGITTAVCLLGKVTGMNKNMISYKCETIEELKANFMAGVYLYLENY
jgi:hypothetical protein